MDNPSVFVLDGGNHFNAFEIAEAVNGDEEALGRIRGSRAFTCYQMASLLEKTDHTDTNILGLDFLSTFYDESVPFHDRSTLLTNCLTHVRRISRKNRLLVIAHPPAVPSPKATRLIKQLVLAADEILPPEVLKIDPKSIEEDDMGKTNPTFAQMFDKIQASFSEFRRAVRLREQLAMDALFAMARQHISAGGLAARPLPFETILFTMLIEQQNQINDLKEKVGKTK